jgi:hypothetical protein
MNNPQHPITPPPELVQQWLRERPESEYAHIYIAARAGQWGADQELEACCEWLDQSTVGMADLLREYRRPEPPSLKEQAFKALGPEPLPVTAPMGDTILNKNIIERHRLLHRALEALPND